MIKLQVVERLTEYYAKKHCIESALKFFQENEKEYFVSCSVEWNDKMGQSGFEEVIVRREVLSHYYGIDVVKAKNFDLKKLAPRHKEDFKELWGMLVKNQLTVKNRLK